MVCSDSVSGGALHELPVITDYAQKSMLKSTTLEKLFKLFEHMVWQWLSLKLHHLCEGRVMFLNKLIEQCLLWTVALIGSILANVKVCSVPCWAGK